MNPGLATILFGGLGYLLVYASVANHGRFALHPWMGLLADAYTGETSTAAAPPASSSSSPSSSSSSSSSSTAAAGTVLTGFRPPRNRLAVQA